MRKAHFAPVVRKIEFAYNEQVVASATPILPCGTYPGTVSDSAGVGLCGTTGMTTVTNIG